LTRI
jgi:hypothetical protein